MIPQCVVSFLGFLGFFEWFGLLWDGRGHNFGHGDDTLRGVLRERAQWEVHYLSSENYMGASTY